MANNNFSKSNTELEGFVPFMYFDNPVFDELLRLAARKNIVKDSSNKDYRLQAKLMLYTNFNKYLGLLLLGLKDNEASDLVEELEQAKTLDGVFRVLESSLGKNREELSEKFFNYFNNL